MGNRAATPSSAPELVDLVVDKERRELLKEVALNLADIVLNERQLCDLELLATGVFTPLTGFMQRADYESVLDRMRLQDGTLWPIPICLDVGRTLAQGLEIGQSVALRDPEGFLLAILHIEDLWQADPRLECQRVYGCRDREHPGVAYLLNSTGEWYLGGGLEVVNLPLHFDFKQLRMTPREIWRMYGKLGW